VTSSHAHRKRIERGLPKIALGISCFIGVLEEPSSTGSNTVCPTAEVLNVKKKLIKIAQNLVIFGRIVKIF
jgi:hypothetical protein